MRRTLLVAVGSALAEMGQPRPQVVVSSSDATVVQMFALLTALCDELAGEHNWQGLKQTYTFTIQPGQDSYPLPADFLRMVSRTLWDTSSRMPVYGPPSDANWATLKNGLAAQPVLSEFRIQGNKLVLLPIPGATHTLSFEYISAKYAINAGDNALKTEFANDADGYVFDDRLIINGLKLKFLETKGFDTSAALSDYNNAKEAAKSSDGSSTALSLTGNHGFRLIGPSNLPDGNWGK